MSENPPIPLFYFGAQNPPHISLWSDPNAFWGAGMGNGARYVFDQRRPMLAQLDYQWAGTYPKNMWDPLPFYRGAPAAPVLNQERLGTFMRAQSEFNELGYQNVLLRDNGVPVGGEIASTPQYRFNGPIQATYMGFMRPVAGAETQPEVLPDWRNIPATQAQARYGVDGGGPFSDPPLQPPGFGTVRGGIGGNWPLYAYRPAFPAELPPPASSDPQMANTNPGPMPKDRKGGRLGHGWAMPMMARPPALAAPVARRHQARFARHSRMLNPLPGALGVAVPWGVVGGVTAGVAALAAGAFLCAGKEVISDDTVLGAITIRKLLRYGGCWKAVPWQAAVSVLRPYADPMVVRHSFKEKDEALAWLNAEAQKATNGNGNNGEDNPTMFDTWISPNSMARATRNNPLSNPMIGGGPGYSGHLNPNMSGMGSMTGYVPNPMIGGGPGYGGGALNPNMTGMGSMTGYVPNPGIPGAPLVAGAPASMHGWMRPVARYPNPGIPGASLSVQPPFSIHGWMRPAARGPNPGGCGKVCPDGTGLNKGCKGFCQQSVGGQAPYCDLDCGDVPKAFAAGPGAGPQPSGGRGPGMGFAGGTHAGATGGKKKKCPAGEVWSSTKKKCVPKTISLPGGSGCPLPGPDGTCPGDDQPPQPGLASRGQRRAAVAQVAAVPRGGAVTRTMGASRGARTVGAVAQVIERNPRGGYRIRSRAAPRGVQRLAGGAQSRSFFCRLFPNSPRCGTITASPGAGCRYNVTTGTWHCPSEGARPSGMRLSNPGVGVVPLGTYSQWAGTRSPSRATLEKVVNPGACCDGCAKSGGSCGSGCGCEGNCNGSCNSGHRHNNP